MNVPNSASKKRPNIFTYHDFREFLLDWVDHLKKRDGHFSLRKLAALVGVSPGLLPQVMSRKKRLTKKTLEKLTPHLGLSNNELSFLGHLRDLSESSQQEDRERAYKRLLGFKQYRELNSQHLEAYRYLNSWLNVTIREMTALDNFRLDPIWIKKQLRSNVPLSEIESSIELLTDLGHIKIDEQGQPLPSKQRILCDGGVFKLSMSQFHTQMLGKAVDSIYETPSEQRNLISRTVAIEDSDFDKIQAIMSEAMEKIYEVTKDNVKSNSNVYHITHLAFPLTKKETS